MKMFRLYPANALSETAYPSPSATHAPQRQQWSIYGDGSLSHDASESIEPALEKQATHASYPFSKHATHLYILSYLIFFSIFGTLARIGLEAITFYSGAPIVTSVLWANFSGSLLMGFLLEDQAVFREEWGPTGPPPNINPLASSTAERHKRIKKTIPLYIGLTTGFCGSFTSFSSFIRDGFLALANDLPAPDVLRHPPRNGGYSFMAVAAVLISTVTLSLGALVFGAHLALAIDRFVPTLPFRFIRIFLDRVFVVFGWGCWLGAVFLAIWPPDRHEAWHAEFWRGRAVFAIVFAPVGCLLRYFISLILNPRLHQFPLGTFVANMTGTVILAMCFDLQHVSNIGTIHGLAAGSAPYSILVSCQILQGMMDGLCGALTTISTWVAELNGLPSRRNAYVYGMGSVGTALGLFVIVVGSLKWTVGLVDPVCT